MRAVTGEITAKVFQVTGLFPCEKNVYRPLDFPLASEDTEATPVNRPALVKTSYHYHSVLLIFRHLLLLRLSVHQISALYQA